MIINEYYQHLYLIGKILFYENNILTTNYELLFLENNNKREQRKTSYIYMVLIYMLCIIYLDTLWNHLVGM